jgi:ParB family chromosome partitioning protein
MRAEPLYCVQVTTAIDFGDRAIATRQQTHPQKKAEPASRGDGVRGDVGAAAGRGGARAGGGPEARGGAVLATFKDPLGGNWQLLAALPLDAVAPTPFQRDLSEPHVERLRGVLDALDRFLDPVIAVPAPDGGFWTPNGNHRLAALRKLGARTITVLLVPEVEVAYRILALNTEKAHNLREKALESSAWRALAECRGAAPEEALRWNSRSPPS